MFKKLSNSDAGEMHKSTIIRFLVVFVSLVVGVKEAVLTNGSQDLLYLPELFTASIVHIKSSQHFL